MNYGTDQNSIEQIKKKFLRIFRKINDIMVFRNGGAVKKNR